ncbi:polarity establishment/cellular polarization [Knufia obscura]|uniref:Polarity establishment/cellular polarization n=2 Tax=Knufia TaxID=430999 RepID=A0AAN8EFX7_9EURO|nr:polarity establishment/cellular polarization [Knufia obscura]KAK5950603.1 polarity establishment/cellular polarization [Knufia fluminis]
MSMLPAIAVADESFSFTFSADTFSSELQIDYTLGDAPIWLQLDGTTRTLTGTPLSTDVGDAEFQIIATDSTGTATSDSSLVVLEQSSLRAKQDVLSERISQAGRYSAPSTLLLYPQTPFHLIFGPDVFEGGDSSVQYYASSDNGTPLPAWLAFDPVEVAFIGTTPPLLTPQSSPQSFAFTLAASQIAGFSQSALSFQISVTNHVLAFLQPTQKITVAAGQEVIVTPLLNQLQLDGAPLEGSRITDTSPKQPEWLSFDSGELSFSGVSPKDLQNTSFQLTVSDDQNDSASIEIQLLVVGQQDNDTVEVFLGTVNATIGGYFNYSFANTSTGSSMREVDVDVGPAGTWLLFTETNSTLQGIVPADTGEDDFNVTLTVSQDGEIIELDYLTITFVTDNSAPATPTSSKSATSSSTVPTSTTPPSIEPSKQASDHRTRDLILMVALPVLTFLAACLIAFVLWRRKRSRGRPPQGNSTTNPMQRNFQNSSSGNIVVLVEPEAQSLSEASFEHLPSSPPPRVDLPWPLRDRPRNKLLSTVDEHDRGSPETRSSWDDMLMEVESPLNYGADADPSRHLESPSATSRLLSSPERSKSPLQGLSTILTSPPLNSRSESFATPRRFNGRRSSGLGHGVGSQRVTLRQVSLSPLSGTPGMLSTPFNPISQSSATPNYNVLHPNTSFTTRLASARKASLASTKSRYAAPQSESSSDQSSRLGRPAPSNRSSSSVYEDDDWTTEGSTSAAVSSSQHSRHPTGGRSLASDDVFAGHEAARQWPLVPALPTAASQGLSLRSQVSDRSQGNSLRFI